MVRRRWDVGLVGLLIVGLLALAGFLAVVGVGLLVTGSIQFADNVASLLSFTLSLVSASTALVVWYRAGVTHRGERRVAREREAGRARPEDHWVRSARGADSAAGFFFTGRDLVLSRLAAMAEASKPALVVILGMPGAGKSAVLGVLILRSRNADELTDPVARRVPQIKIDSAVHARGKAVQDVVAELNAAFGVVAVDLAHEQETLFRILRGRQQTPVIVADAVDEAADPAAMGAFLSQLSWRALVLAGTRSDKVARAGNLSSPPTGMRTRAPLVVDLSAEYADRGEVGAYVSARLRVDPRPGGYADDRRWTDQHLFEIVGWEVAAAAEDNFLVAQMITDELLSRPALRAIARGWSDTLDWPDDFAGWMDRDLERRLGVDNRWLADALIPLAFTERDGLPLELWLAAAEAFDLDRRIGRPEVARAIDVLAFYLSAAPLPAGGGEDGEVGYQLRHERFADYFRRSALTGQRRRAMAEVVLGSIPRSRDGIRCWGQMSAYARRNVLAHAARAGSLGDLLEEDPLCLAAVGTTAALEAATALGGPAGRDLGRIVRRASYGRDGSYAGRAAQLEFHARLVGSLDLAAAFASAAAVGRSWDTPWRAGGSSAALPDGDPLTTKAVLPVVWPSPAAVIIDEDFNAEVLDLVTRSPLGPRVRLRDAAGRQPDVWSAREIAGSVHLVAAQEEGDIRVWCLAGPLASPEVRAAGHSPEAIRSVEIFPGPGGVALVAALTAERPGHLKIWAATAGRIKLFTPGDLVGGDHAVGLRGTSTAAKLVIASLGSGLRTVEITAVDAVPTVATGTDRPTTLLVAEGDADEAIALISLDQRIHAVVLRADRIEILPRPLGDGGPSARPALRSRPALLVFPS